MNDLHFLLLDLLRNSRLILLRHQHCVDFVLTADPSAESFRLFCPTEMDFCLDLVSLPCAGRRPLMYRISYLVRACGDHSHPEHHIIRASACHLAEFKADQGTPNWFWDVLLLWSGNFLRLHHFDISLMEFAVDCYYLSAHAVRCLVSELLLVDIS